MTKIESHISTLLYRYDCVIIPGLGGFVANLEPASLQPEKQLAMPPSKGIIFNKNLTGNDGLLADAIARAENLPYSEAKRRVADFVSRSREKLGRGESLIFEDLGVLYTDRDGVLRFRPDFSVNFLVESFGLYPVAAREIRQAVNEARVLTPPEAKIIPLEPQPESEEELAVVRTLPSAMLRRYAPVAATLAPIVFYSLWIPLKTDFLQTGTLQLSDLNPFASAKTISYEPRSEAFIWQPATYNAAEEWKKLSEGTADVAQVQLDNGSTLNLTVRPAETESTYVAPPSVVIPATPKNASVHIIGGCFAEPDNADKLVQQLQSEGLPAYILDKHHGLHRVAMGSYTSMDEALQALRQVRDKGHPSAWILRK